MTNREMEIAFGLEAAPNANTILADVQSAAWAIYNTQTDTNAYFPERTNCLTQLAQVFAAYNKIVANNAAAHAV